MSNALAIATVTTALAQIARTAAQSVVVGSDALTERPAAAASDADARVRLFLYQVAPNAALANDQLPLRSADGTAVRRPTVALDLFYLFTFEGNERDLEPQRMLGAVVRDLNGKPVLTRQMIADAVASETFLAGSNLGEAPEQVKFTPLPVSVDELSKLWSLFSDVPYILAMTYRATVVLIDSEDAGRAPPPVLRRGEEDRGVDAVLGAFPALAPIHIGAQEDADRQPPLPSHPSARLGSLLTLRGRNLAGDSARVRFTHPRLATPIEISVAPAEHRADRLRVAIPDDAAAAAAWVAGLYAVDAVIARGGNEQVTNRQALALAPSISAIAPPNPIPRDAFGTATLTITCRPRVQSAQSALLQFAGREVAADDHPVATADLVFTVTGAPVVTDALVRLRVGGVDSLPFVRRAVPPPPRLVFDDAQRITIQ